jgi:hypothetical protein
MKGLLAQKSPGCFEGKNPSALSAGDLAPDHRRQPILRVIRAKCLDCCCGQASEVAKCTAVACALWPYRMASNPFSKRRGNSANLKGQGHAE